MITVRYFFAWYDLWVGFYWDKKKKALYVCPLPMLCFRIGKETVELRAGQIGGE